MSVFTPVRADWRALSSAILIGSGIGLGLGAAYLAGGMARTATDHARASRLAEAAAGGYSESVLQREAAAMDPGVLRVLRAHDPIAPGASAQRERQATVLAARLDRQAPDDRRMDPRVMRAAFSVGPAAAPFQMAGALESSRELDCLTQAVYFEARGEGSAGQAAVAQVVLNRVRNPAFPKTICGVVFQGAAHRSGCQFSFACDGSMRRGRELIAWDRAQHIAARALSGSVMAAVGNATHFHTINVQPVWGPNLLRVAQVGLHVFYRFGRGGAPVAYPADGGSELNAGPILASLAAPALTSPAGPSELRLATALVTAAPADAPAGLRGSVEPADPATEAKPAAKAADAAKPATAKLTPASQPGTDAPKSAATTAS